MLHRLRVAVGALALIFMCSCAGLSTLGPRVVDGTLLAIDSAMPASVLVARASCAKSDDEAKCITTVDKAHAGAVEAMKVVKEWAPKLKDAMVDGDEIKARTAREHMEAALEQIPDAYEDVRDLVLRLMK
jgi:hypothetical protein